MRIGRVYRPVPFSVALAAILLLPGSAGAVWTHDPTLATAVCTATGNQSYVVSASDGAGGVIVAWADPRSGTNDIYAQRLNASGVPQWTPNGVLVCGAAQDQSQLSIAADGGGGVFLAWYDNRTFGADIYAQRILSNGSSLWTANGVPVCTASGTQGGPFLVSDGVGGIVVTWSDSRGLVNADVYAQRLNPMGFPSWTTDGVVVCNATGDQNPTAIVADGFGGSIVCWQDRRAGNWDIYAQRLNSSGTAQWAANGSPMCTANNDQTAPTMTADGSGGALIAFEDFRSGSSYDVYIQRANGTFGNGIFNSNGIALSTGTGDQRVPVTASDGNGGAVVAWWDSRSSGQDIYAQRITGAATLMWTSNGQVVCNAPGFKWSPQILADGSGGAFIDWQDPRGGDYDLYTQHVLSSGAGAWAANGVAVCTSPSSQYQGPLVSDGNGGAIVAFVDSHNAADDVYAQRISRFGQLGMPEPTIASVRDVPNDQGGSVKVSWFASWLDQASDPNLTAYDVYRSAPGSLATAAIRAGAAQRLAGFGAAPTEGERAFVLPASTNLYAWEYLGTVNAVHFLSAYGYIAPTTGDSLGGSNPTTAFLVVGRNASGSMYWVSAPDSGYSVDNIAPATPAPFAGQYGGGSTALHWGPNTEADFAHYELYRGTSASFTPGPGNRVASPADTGYVDASGAPNYYKLAAVDVHGNTSGYATLLPGGTVSVAPGVASGRVSLAPPSPNPVRFGASIRFELANAGHATLALFDQQGRRVRELLDGVLPAGVRTVAWDGRDAGGAFAPSGLYFLRLDTEGRTLTQRAVVAR